VCPERGTLSLVSTIVGLLERKSSCSGLKSREYCRRDASLWPRSSLYTLNLALTSPTRGGRSVGIVRSRTQATKIKTAIPAHRPWTPIGLWLSALRTGSALLPRNITFLFPVQISVTGWVQPGA
jgi:hypothetical protein